MQIIYSKEGHVSYTIKTVIVQILLIEIISTPSYFPPTSKRPQKYLINIIINHTQLSKDARFNYRKLKGIVFYPNSFIVKYIQTSLR